MIDFAPRRLVRLSFLTPTTLRLPNLFQLELTLAHIYLTHPPILEYVPMFEPGH